MSYMRMVHSDDEIHVSLKNLTIRNAGGGGFDCIAFSYVTTGEISNNKILNSQEGEGISIRPCHGLTIRANTIMNNKIGRVYRYHGKFRAKYHRE